ncbi:hypothetical protein Taro_022934 [Colocasia esculenta]|uniref:Uncharacterized protein n=1 Tax=Colocasia esculenta TaxID=4460 RepID=A0A843VCY2_COLES|nr:hypothetical protein [Colocasia esculenta]
MKVVTVAAQQQLQFAAPPLRVVESVALPATTTALATTHPHKGVSTATAGVEENRSAEILTKVEGGFFIDSHTSLHAWHVGRACVKVQIPLSHPRPPAPCNLPRVTRFLLTPLVGYEADQVKHLRQVYVDSQEVAVDSYYPPRTNSWGLNTTCRQAKVGCRQVEAIYR